MSTLDHQLMKNNQLEESQKKNNYHAHAMEKKLQANPS